MTSIPSLPVSKPTSPADTPAKTTSPNITEESSLTPSLLKAYAKNPTYIPILSSGEESDNLLASPQAGQVSTMIS